MSRVQILDDIVVNQIAAGEVIERPASVVKELVENSIDANASEITVIISQGGSSIIEVIDNGSGMSKSDAMLAIERFGTSKITNVEDLQHIHTHGFRGEALPSIASVSRFVLRTQASADNGAPGVEIEIAGGAIKGVTEKPLSKGTRISVQNLFYNIPARRRFLRSDKTEAGLIKTQLIDFAAAYPSIRIKLLCDGTEVMNLFPCDTFSDRLEQLKLDDNGQFFSVSCETPTQSGLLKLKGMLSVPVDSVAASGKLRLLVNGRSVRDRVILKAVRDGYGTMIKPGKYPSGILAIEIPPEEVDVNVHPQKAEVRFRTPEKLYQLVVRAVANALSQQQPAYQESDYYYAGRSVDSAPRQPVVSFAPINHTTSMRFEGDNSISSDDISTVVQPRLFNYNELERNSKSEIAVYDFRDLRFIGQILACFLLFEGSDRFVIIDMHAAHERVTYYKLRIGFEKGGIPSQQLLLPEELSINDEEVECFNVAASTLKALGFTASLEGENKIVVSAVPAVFYDLSIRELFRDLLSLELWHSWSEHLDRRMDEILARIACHSSVRSGRILQKEEAYKLLDEISMAEGAAFCPHGRPIAKVYSRADLETMFGRIQQ